MRSRFSGESMVPFDVELLAMAFGCFCRLKDHIQELIYARIQIFHGKFTALYRFDQLYGQETDSWSPVYIEVFIPEDNEYDLKEVAEEVKDTLEIVPVKDVETLLKAAGAVL